MPKTTMRAPTGSTPPPIAQHPHLMAAEPSGANSAMLTFDDLTPHEQAVASLGIEPGQLKPIGWMNEMHYDALKKTNALDPSLQRRIEAHKVYHEANSM
jgi:hypothetical protein